MSEKKEKGQFRGKPYATPADKGKQKVSDGKKPSGGAGSIPVKCYKCGEPGHKANVCNNSVLRCHRCGQKGHRIGDCPNDVPTYFNCGEQGHISTQCQKPKKTATAAQTNGRVFALSGSEVPKKDNLIRGTCFINDVELVAIIDTGATHSFVSLECATRLGLNLSDMNGSMVIETPANGSVTTTRVCLKCSLTIYGKSFLMDLVCLPLQQSMLSLE